MFLEKTENEKTHRAESPIKMEAEHGVLLPQAKECHGLLAATKRHLDHGLLAPRPRENTFLLFKAMQSVVIVTAALGNKYTLPSTSPATYQRFHDFPFLLRVIAFILYILPCL